MFIYVCSKHNQNPYQPPKCPAGECPVYTDSLISYLALDFILLYWYMFLCLYHALRFIGFSLVILVTFTLYLWRYCRYQSWCTRTYFKFKLYQSVHYLTEREFKMWISKKSIFDCNQLLLKVYFLNIEEKYLTYDSIYAFIIVSYRLHIGNKWENWMLNRSCDNLFHRNRQWQLQTLDYRCDYNGSSKKMKPVIVNGDVFMWMKNSWVERKTLEERTTIW